MKPDLNDTFLAKWMEGTLSDKELQQFKKSEEYADYVKIAEKSKLFYPPAYNAAKNWEHIKKQTISHHLIEKPSNHFKKIDTENKASIRAFKPQSSRKKTSHLSRNNFLLKAAAVAVLLIGSAILLPLLFGTVNVQTKLAQHNQLILPDNSSVILNGNSNIQYNKAKWPFKRELFLEGEAFFKVTKGSTFEVTTNLGTVTVVGTQFNVDQRANYLRVNCFEGIVKVTTPTHSYTLTKGNYVTLLNNKANQGNFIPNTHPTWIKGESSFNNTPLTIVLNELKTQYNITIQTNNLNLNKNYTGSFTHNNLNTALHSVCDPLQITFTINDTTVTLQNK